MKLRTSKAAVTASAALLFLSLILSLLSALCAIVMSENKVYSDGGIYMREEIAEWIFREKTNIFYDYADLLMNNDDIPNNVRESYEKQFSREMTNLAVKIVLHNYTEETVEHIYMNYLTDENYQYKFTSTHVINGSKTNYKGVAVTAYLQHDLVAEDTYYYVMPLVDFLIESRDALIWVSAVSLLVALTLLIFMLCAAGHVKGSEEIQLSRFDKVPTDVILAIYFFFTFFIFALFDEVFIHNDAGVLIFWLFAVIVGIPLYLKLILSIAVRIKSRTLLKNTMIWRILKLIWRGFLIICDILSKIHLYFKTALVFAAWGLIEFLFLAVGYDEYTVFWLITRPIIIAALVYFVLMLRRLQKGADELAGGNTYYRVDTKYMLPDLKAHGNALNSLSLGLSRAVEERMKSERMKSELITNVSHDIKTPLTSIISYVDLLKTGGLDSPDAPTYLEVLDKQSARLKKLTEDLIEASKAASGTLSCIPEPTDVNILLSQALGEYEEQLLEAGIEPIYTAADTAAVVMADGRLLWRVFDNLFSNIRKYAMPSTRAYFSCECINGNAVITFRNISDMPIGISADELCERFVRGDESRHTDGSGLGLSIARSLTELQGGCFDITVDGDLFKVTVTFALCEIGMAPLTYEADTFFPIDPQ